MGKMELEVKVLNINEQELISRIEANGGKFINKYNQYLYTYDTPTIYSRYIDNLILINHPEKEIDTEIATAKFKLLFFDIDNLTTPEQKQKLKNIIDTENISDILKKENFIEILNRVELKAFLEKFHNNPKKWIRLRKSNDVTTLAVKHILADDGSNIQQMLETEIEVPSMRETNDILEELGYSYHSYQEKKRTSYMLNGHEIDIDTWPGIPTYMEVEGKDEEDLNSILNLLGYSMKDTVSCTADDVYVMYGIDSLSKRELKF